LGLLNVASTPLQGMIAQKEFEKWKQEHLKNPNALSRINPMTGMPEIVRKGDMVV
jgi:hypothetical protein